jgi:hypothetical protein
MVTAEDESANAPPPQWRLIVASKSKLNQTLSNPQQSAAPLPTKKFAAAYGLHPSTVWRAVRDGRLEYVMVGKRKFVLPPVVQRNRPLK